ncbi:MAG: ATP-dependent DNA ligase [Chromatiales bacterium]
MQLAEIVATSERVRATRSRLEKIALLAQCLRRLPPALTETGTAYLAGSLPQGRIGIGYAVLQVIRVTAPATEPQLTLTEVDAFFSSLARMTGRGSATERRTRLGALFARATRDEQSFLANLLTGGLRQGALEGLMTDAIAQAAGLPASDIRRAIMLAGDAAPVARAALAEGAPGLQRFRLELLKPVQPMLAQAADGIAEALQQFGRACVEYKVDGARVQVHKRHEEVRVFTRALNDVTAAVPEVVAAVRALPARTLILDGEALALRADGTAQPFQVTMRRFGRRLDVEAMRAELPLSAFFFDCLHLDGVDLIDQPTGARIEVMAQALPCYLIIPRLLTADAREAEVFMKQAFAQGHEGVMVKALNAPYEAGNRGATWLKIKRAHTLDLVVLAVEWGSGRRRGWLSNLHLGARDPVTGGFVMLGKTFKGMTDAMLKWQTERLQALALAQEGYVVHVRPELVVEIAFNDIQASPHYPGGLALRFARVRRFREDKSAGQSDTIETVRSIYEQQFAKLSSNVPSPG